MPAKTSSSCSEVRLNHKSLFQYFLGLWWLSEKYEVWWLCFFVLFLVRHRLQICLYSQNTKSVCGIIENLLYEQIKLVCFWTLLHFRNFFRHKANENSCSLVWNDFYLVMSEDERSCCFTLLRASSDLGGPGRLCAAHTLRFTCLHEL